MIDTQTLSAWIQSVQGKYIDMDGAYGAQCWDLSAHWAKYIGKPVINTGGPGRWPGWAGNMVDAFPQSAEIAAAYTLHGPNETGEPGDIVVWGDSYWYYPATHVAVLVADKGNQLQCMSQNSTPSRADNPYPGASSGPTTIQSLPRQGLIGFIRPNVGGISAQGDITPVQEDEFMTTPEEFVKAVFDYRVTSPGGGSMTLGEMVAESRGGRSDLQSDIKKIPAAVLHEPFVRVGKDGQPSGLTTLAGVVGAQEANVELDRGLTNAPVTVVVDSLITAGIAEEVVRLIGERFAK